MAGEHLRLQQIAHLYLAVRVGVDFDVWCCCWTKNTKRCDPDILSKDLDRISGCRRSFTRLIIRQRGAEEWLAGECGVESKADEREREDQREHEVSRVPRREI